MEINYDKQKMLNDLYYLYKQSRDWNMFGRILDEVDGDIDRIISSLYISQTSIFDSDDLKSELKLYLVELVDKYDEDRGVPFYRYMFYNLGVKAKHFVRSQMYRLKNDSEFEVESCELRIGDKLMAFKNKMSKETLELLKEYVFCDKCSVNKRHIKHVAKLFRKNRKVMCEMEDLLELVA